MSNCYVQSVTSSLLCGIFREIALFLEIFHRRSEMEAGLKAGLLSANKVHWVQKSVIQTRDWKPRKDILSFVWTVGSHFVWPSPSPPLQTNIWRYTVGNNAWIFSAVERHPLLTRFRGSRCAKPPKCRHEIQPVNLACYTSSRSCLKIPAENSWIRKIRK